MKNEEATCIITLLHQIVTFLYLAEIELLQQNFSDSWRKVWEGEVSCEGVRYHLPILRFFLPKNIGEPLVNHLLAIVLQSSQFSNLPPFLVISLLGVRFLDWQFKITQCTEQSDLCPSNFFHDYKFSIASWVFLEVNLIIYLCIIK